MMLDYASWRATRTPLPPAMPNSSYVDSWRRQAKLKEELRISSTDPSQKRILEEWRSIVSQVTPEELKQLFGPSIDPTVAPSANFRALVKQKIAEFRKQQLQQTQTAPPPSTSTSPSTIPPPSDPRPENQNDAVVPPAVVTASSSSATPSIIVDKKRNSGTSRRSREKAHVTAKRKNATNSRSTRKQPQALSKRRRQLFDTDKEMLSDAESDQEEEDGQADDRETPSNDLSDDVSDPADTEDPHLSSSSENGNTDQPQSRGGLGMLHKCAACNDCSLQTKMQRCTTCSEYYHVWCVDMPRVIPVVAADKWVCSDCDASGVAPPPSSNESVSCQYLWDRVQLVTDNYQECNAAEDGQKLLLNHFLAAALRDQLRGRFKSSLPLKSTNNNNAVACNLPDSSATPEQTVQLFVLDGKSCNSSLTLYKECRLFLDDVGKTDVRVGIVTANPTQSALSIRQTYRTLSVADSKSWRVVPLSAVDYFSGHYSKWYPVVKFDMMYLDFCGGQPGQLDGIEQGLAKSMTLPCILGLTLCRRNLPNALQQAEDWVMQNLMSALSGPAFVSASRVRPTATRLIHVQYHTVMFTLVYKVEIK